METRTNNHVNRNESITINVEIKEIDYLSESLKKRRHFYYCLARSRKENNEGAILWWKEKISTINKRIKWERENPSHNYGIHRMASLLQKALN